MIAITSPTGGSGSGDIYTWEAPAAIVEILDPISIKRFFLYTEIISVKR